jgi:hypothetical protein
MSTLLPRHFNHMANRRKLVVMSLPNRSVLSVSARGVVKSCIVRSRWRHHLWILSKHGLRARLLHYRRRVGADWSLRDGLLLPRRALGGGAQLRRALLHL